MKKSKSISANHAGNLSSLPTQMSYKGQNLMHGCFREFFFSAIVGFIYGFLSEQLGWTVCIVCFVFVDISSMAHLSLTSPQVVTCSDSGTEDKKSGDRKSKRRAKSN